MGRSINVNSHGQVAPDRYGLGAWLVYVALSSVFFGRSLIGHFSSRYLGNGADPSQFMWYMRWWPYAISHHLNPFWPRIIWPPAGVDIAWAASMPLPSLIAYPLTETLGLIPTFNLLCLLCPALAGWAAFILCRYITRAYGPSLIGGFIFGFSAHMLGKTFGNLNDALVFAVPLSLYFCLLWLDRRLNTRTFVILLALLLATAFLSFIETFATMTLFGSLALMLAVGLSGQDTRKRFLAMIGPLALSYACAVILVSPYFYFLVAHRMREAEIMPAAAFSIDPLNLFLPTPLNELGKFVFLSRLTSQFFAQLTESGGYIALPVIVIAILFTRKQWHTFYGRVLVDFLLLCLIFSLGPRLHVLGSMTAIGLPWLPFASLPFIQKALPARFMLYAFLDLAMMTSIWLAELDARSSVKLAIAAAVLVFMLPNLSSSYWTVDANIPAFFAGGMYKQYLSPGDRVIILPYSINGDSMLWQAQSNMYFDMVQGWTGFPLAPAQFEDWPIVQVMIDNIDLPEPGPQLKAFVANYDVRAIIMADDCACTWQYHPNDLAIGAWTRASVSSHDRQLWNGWLSTLGIEPTRVGNILFYKINPQQFSAYKDLTAMHLKLVDAEYRLSALITAGARYVQSGQDLSKLSPVRAMELHLLPAKLISQDVSTRRPQHTPIQSQLLLTKSDDGNIVVGVVAPYSILEQLVMKFGAHATDAHFLSMDPPFVPVRKPSGGMPLLLFMSFDRASLLSEASRIDPTKSQAFLTLRENRARRPTTSN